MRTWLKVEGKVVSHRKTKHLARLWGCSPYTAVGFLVAFWDYLLEFQSDGQASDLRAEELDELAAPCQQRALTSHLTVLDALKEAGFVDPDGRAHDWEDYAGALVTRRQRDRDRKRDERKTGKGRPMDTPRTSAPRAEQSRAETENQSSSSPAPADLLAWIPDGYHQDLEARIRSSHSPAGIVSELRLLRQEPESRGLKGVTGEHVGQALRDAALKGGQLTGKRLANFVRVAQSPDIAPQGRLGGPSAARNDLPVPVTPLRRADLSDPSRGARRQPASDR